MAFMRCDCTPKGHEAPGAYDMGRHEWPNAATSVESGTPVRARRLRCAVHGFGNLHRDAGVVLVAAAVVHEG